MLYEIFGFLATFFGAAALFGIVGGMCALTAWVFDNGRGV